MPMAQLARTWRHTVLLVIVSAHSLLAQVLNPEQFRHYVERFNRIFPEEVVNAIPDQAAWDWMVRNIPWFECPDKEIEELYYYRWWAYRKHIRHTPRGYIITEFLKPVSHAVEYNALSCALGHHVYEGRWLRDPQYLDDHLRFWLCGGPDGRLHPALHRYSGWIADAVWNRWLVDQRTDFALSLLDALVEDFRAWERERRLPDGLFWQYDVRDGMEESASGSRTAKNIRPTINSYMYGNAVGLAQLARLAGQHQLAHQFEQEAIRLRRLVERHLWDPQARFFKVRLESGQLAPMRELIGYVPWYFKLPTPRRGFEVAWKELFDPTGFYAPFGPTTVERRHPSFRIAWDGDDCQWNGPSWPFLTSMVLRAMANVIQEYPQRVLGKEHYWSLFRIYTRSQHRRLPDGTLVPWIDENLEPFTGEWLARAKKIKKGRFYGRGDHYNHSTYADLLITGLVGLRPRADELIEVHPLLPPNEWEWFCLDAVTYHGRRLTIIWDVTGKRYGRGRGLSIWVNGAEVARARTLSRLQGTYKK